jgi:hypothetical protein
MTEDMYELQVDLAEEVTSRANSSNMMREAAFTDHFSDYLMEFGEVDQIETTAWQDKNIGVKIDGSSFDDDHETVTLVTSIWKEEGNNNKEDFSNIRITNSEINSAVKRVKKFFTLCMDGKLPGDRIDVGNPAYDIAKTIWELRKELTTVRIIVITNGITKPREGETDEIHGKNVQITIWDGPRLLSHLQNTARKGISIDFNEYGGPIKCVQQESSTGKYDTYLAFVSGSVLADLYSVHKTRLLEKNVRVFLSQRVNVNKGIRDTILNEPDMFCAYNNGITVYAESIDCIEKGNGIVDLSNVNDFQIVNGGQTTASLYHTRKKNKCELDKIQVQMKLMVIHDGEINGGKERLSDILVPKIGKFSNTQNRIQMSDLSANDKPHPEIFAISKNSVAPDPTGGTKTSYWFYEKSRGAWNETRNLESNTQAQRKSWDAKYPRNQRFDKGLFSKVWFAHLGKPNIVSLGPQKCFARFHTTFLAERVKEQTDWPKFFRKTVGLLLIWKAVEKEVGAKTRTGEFQRFRQNITAYTIALFSHKTNQKIGLEQLWQKQKVPEDIMNYLMELSYCVHEHITKLPDNMSIVTEYCKKEDCWKALLEKAVPLPPASLKRYINTSEKKMSVGRDIDEENIQFCTQIGSDAWWSLASYLKERDFGSTKARSQCGNMARILKSGRTPSKTLAYACRQAWENAISSYSWKWDK